MRKCRNATEVAEHIKTLRLVPARAQLLKFGTITISDFDLPDDAECPVEDRDRLVARFKGEGKEKTSADLMAAIASHPNVFDFSGGGADGFEGSIDVAGTTLLRGPICKASVHLPKGQQKYQHRDCKEHFEVLISGTFFAAVAEVDTFTPYSNMAHEFREMFRARVHSQVKCEVPLLGPCPIHNDMIILEVDEEGSTAPSGEVRSYPIVVEFRGNLCIVVPVGEGQKVVDRVFRDCLFYLEDYYVLELNRNLLIESDIEIQNRLGALVSAYNDFADLSSWRLKRVGRALSNAKRELAKIYELHVRHGRQASAHSRRRKKFLDRLSESRTLNALVSSFRAGTELDVDKTDALLPSLQFFQQQTEAKSSIYALAAASLVGAVIGGLITSAATLLQHHP
jgi:hypothetical protein